ncbi:sigma-70 family RNA polymerase sigma factor [Mariniblastus sp.]|nr:sigma-70 family RNA polymerase sigma factor [Mariniblastus sp.]
MMEQSTNLATPNIKMPTADPRQFIQLLMENERRIYAFIRSMLGNATDTEDVLQETSIVLWEKFDGFDQADGNFIVWSFKIAFYVAQNFRRKQGRSKVIFSDHVFDAVADKTEQMFDQLDQRHEVLSHCVEKLTPKDQGLLRLRYDFNNSIEMTAEKSGRTIAAVYKALSRVRAALHQCINRTIEAQESPRSQIAIDGQSEGTA